MYALECCERFEPSILKSLVRGNFTSDAKLFDFLSEFTLLQRHDFVEQGLYEGREDVHHDQCEREKSKEHVEIEMFSSPINDFECHSHQRCTDQNGQELLFDKIRDEKFQRHFVESESLLDHKLTVVLEMEYLTVERGSVVFQPTEET